MDNLYLNFRVKHQNITRMDLIKIVSGSQNYVKAKFNFSSDWNGITTKTVRFSCNDENYDVILNNDECLVPWEIIAESGYFDVSVFGGSLITVDVARVYVTESGYAKGGSPIPPTPSVYEQIIDKLNEIEAEFTVEGIKATVDEFLATKSFITEADVETIVNRILAASNYATKSDIENMATQDDIKDFITEEKVSPIVVAEFESHKSEFVGIVDEKLGKIVEVSPNVYYFKANGLMKSGTVESAGSTSYWYSDFISAKANDVIRFSKHVSWASSTWINLFDSNKTYIGSPSSNEIDVTHNDYDEFTISKSNCAYVVISFSKYDVIIDKEKDMVTVNADYPKSYIAPKVVALNSTIGLSKTQNEEVLSIVESANIKPFVLINFDSFNFEDNRFSIVNDEFGFRATVNLGTQYPTKYTQSKADNYSRLYANGWDCALYSGTNFPIDTYGDGALVDNPSAEIQNAWDDYVAIGIEDAIKNGFFEPLTWFARQNMYCVGLQKALDKHGIKVCRANNVLSGSSLSIPTVFTNAFSMVTRTNGLYPSTVNDVLGAIDNAVNSNVGISIFSHGLYATEEQASANYGCTEANLRTVLTKIKDYVNEGKLEVITYRDMYNKYKPSECNSKDYTRIMKRIQFMHESH